MPPAIPVIAAAAAAAASAAGPALATALATIGISVSASVAGAIIGAVVAFAVTYVGNALLGSSKSAANNSSSTAAAVSDRTQLIRQSVAPHRIILGTVKVSGVLAFIYSPNVSRIAYSSALKGGAAADYKPNQMLYLAAALAGHPASAIHRVTRDCA